jgi:hypothetical protein
MTAAQNEIRALYDAWQDALTHKNRLDASSVTVRTQDEAFAFDLEYRAACDAEYKAFLAYNSARKTAAPVDHSTEAF